MKNALLLSSIIALSTVISGAQAADYTYSNTATVAENFAALGAALAGTGTYSFNDGVNDYTIDGDFAAAHPKTTRDALGQILMGSSDSGSAGVPSYAGVASAVDTYMGLTGALVSRDTLGVDVNNPLDTNGYISAYAGSEYIENATSMADADKKLAAEIVNLNTALVGKVDAVAGKGLSTNDYTDADAAKVAGLKGAAEKDMAVAFVRDTDDSTTVDQEIAAWVATEGNKIADVATTFGVFTEKLNDVNTDINNALATKQDVLTDGDVTLNMLESSVQESLGKANSALQNDALIDTALTGNTTAESLKVGGNDVLTTANVGPDYSADVSHTLSDVLGYVTANGSSVATVATTAGLVEDLLNDKEKWIGQELGYDTTVTDAATELSSAGFTATDLLGAIVENKDAINTKAGLDTDNTFTGKNTFEDDVLVKGAFGAGANGTEFTVDASGNVVADGSATVNSLEIGTTGKGINESGAATLASVKLGGNTVNAIDKGTSKISSGNGTTIATTATVLKSAENATYTAGASATNTTNGTLNSAIASLDSAIGNRGTLNTGNNHLTTTGTIVANLNALDAAIGNTTFSGTNASGASNLTAAVNALDAEIGADADYVQTYNGVAGTQTVKQNINAINETIGDIATLAAGTGSTGNALTNGTGTAAADVVTALNNIDATLGQIHGLKNGNSHLKTNSNLANGTTVEQHLVALDDAIGNRNISSANAEINAAMSGTSGNVASAMETTGNLIGTMDFDGTQYLAGVTNLTEAVKTLDSNIERVENRLEKVNHNLKSGLAAVSALSALVPNARDCGDTQLSVGTGVYADRVGVAVGGFHYFNDHVLFNAGASYGGTRDWAFRAGLTFGI